MSIKHLIGALHARKTQGDQNDASEMRKWMNQCRRLIDLGATAAVLHHDGKAETAHQSG